MKPGMLKTILLFLFISTFLTSFPQGHNYDIRNYDLFIQPDFAVKTLVVNAVITIDNPKLENKFTFGLNNNYTKIEIKSDSSPVTFKHEDAWIIVNVQNPTEKQKLYFSLEGIPGQSIDEKRDVIEEESLFLLWSDRFYPIDFDDWAIIKTTINLPANFLVIAPGSEISSLKNGSIIEYVYQSSIPEANYSVFADARWVREERVINGIKMQTFLYPGSSKYSEQIFKTSSEVLNFYSQTLCPYPFDKFSFITISGMYARRAFTDFIGYTPAYLEKEFSITGHDAHETSLIWWGHIMTGRGNGGWQWIEGFGDYSEIYFDKKFNKPVPKIFQLFREKYLAADLSKDFLYSELRGNTKQEFIHGKYPWLMHFLRYRIGDEKFDNAMLHLFKNNKFRTVSIEEFLAALEEGSGVSLKWFRDEWLERRGVPEVLFSYEISGNSGAYKINCTVKQKGNIYHLPLEIGIVTGEGMRIEKINLDKNEMIFSFDSVQKPEEILLDPNEWVIMKKYQD